MTRVHDVGGQAGQGPIALDQDARPFKAAWEARMWGINEAIVNVPGWNLDWWRHVRELIGPEDYLERSYFDQWMQVYAAMMVDSGVATIAEVASGKAVGPKPALEAPMRAVDIDRISRHAADFRRSSARRPAFGVGDAVATRVIGGRAHTRLPGYAMGKNGEVHACHGNHILPDENAHGREVAEPLYSIAFAAADLWPEAKGRRDRIFIDLWESYLERR